jgi:predicted transcriptional regulator
VQLFSNKVECFSDIPIGKKKNLIPKILGDSYCTTILEVLQEIPKSCVEISMDTRIPISTTYRRVQILHDLGLLQISGSISSDGKKCFLYKSKVKSIEAKFDGKLEVKIKLI